MSPRIANPLSIIATMILIAAVCWLGIRRSILGAGPMSQSIQVLGLLIVVWARLEFGIRSFHFAASPTQGGLVTSGPYRYVRNPIYSSALLIILMGPLTHPSLGNFVLLCVVAGALVIRILCEERLLPLTYPEYQDYARRTPRLFPFLI